MAQVRLQQGYDERRAFQRNPIYLRALCITAEDVGYNCIIHDFCRGGMYLEFEPPPGVALPSPGTLITLRCTVPLTDRQQELRMPARVVRTSDNFCGISFTAHDPGAIPILQEFACSQQSDKTAYPSTGGGPSAGKAQSGNHQALLQTCFDKANDQGMVLAKRFLDDCMDHLDQRLDEEKDMSLQHALFTARETLAKHEAMFQRNFSHALRRHLKEASSRAADEHQRDEQDLNPSEFSLVEDSAFDRWLTLVELSNSAETQHRQELAGLEQRLAIIYGTSIQQENNPFHPSSFSRAYLDALESLEMDERAHHDCHMSFKRTLADFLIPLYEDLNQFLIGNHILPDLSLITRSEQRPRPQHDQAAPDTEAPHTAETGGEGEQHTQQETGRIGQPSFTSLASNLQALQAELNSRESHMAGASTPGHGHQAYYKTDEVLQAISSLPLPQAETASTLPAERDYHAQISNLLNDDGEGNDERHLARREQTLLKIAGSLFTSLMQDMLIAVNVRAWLQKIEIPLLKVAVTDESLFNDRNHAARRVVNHLSELELYDEAGADSAICRKINQLLEQISATSDVDLGVYEHVSRELGMLVDIQREAYQANLDDLRKQCETEQNGNESVGAGSSKRITGLDEHLQHWIDKVHRLTLGDWMLFGDNEDNPLRLRLAWISKHHDRYVFVNLRGLRERTLTHLELARLLADGTVIPLENADDPALDRAQYNMLQHLHRQLLHESSHDPLTGLLNRHSFDNELRNLLARNRQSSKSPHHTLCYLKIGQFGLLNSSRGYEGGDRFLADLAAHMRARFHEDTLLARLGGSKFGILFEGCPVGEANTMVREMMSGVKTDLAGGGREISPNFSAGLVALEEHDNLTTLLQAAEASCKVAEGRGSNHIHLYREDDEEITRQLDTAYWLERVHEALDRNNLSVRCQPIVPITSDGYGAPHHREVLLSVLDEDGRPVSPEPFILAAEHYDLMPGIDRWVVEHVFAWLRDNQDRLASVGSLAINLSGRSLNDPGFRDFMLDICRNAEIPMEHVCFEVTETAGISSLSDTSDFILRLKESGCHFSLDDFGSGMSSYGYLKNLPVDYLKIDGSFVKEIDQNPNDYAVVKSICEIGHFMGKKIIAEYVESEAILNELRTIGVDYAQGFAVGRPCPLQEL